MSKQEIKDALVSVLCDPEGKVCIDGSDEDRDILQRAIESLDDYIVIKKADVPSALSEITKPCEVWECGDGGYGALICDDKDDAYSILKTAKLVNEAMKEE